MHYSELIKKLFSINLFTGMKQGLDNPHRLDAALDYPSKKFASIHIAGTNGKGSVTKKIATTLQYAGNKTGCYTSPHISCFRERICINGEMISEQAVERILERIFKIIDEQQIPATFFEITTLLAFTYFAEQNVDWAIIETGLGGRLDATNIINPKISVITSISLDHTEHLGNTIEEIAKEKAGIVKSGVPLVLGLRMPHEVFINAAIASNSPYNIVQGHFSTYEEENCATAQLVLKILNIDPQYIQKGMYARLPCRLETHIVHTNKPVKVILDVAHNPDGLTQLFHALRNDFPSAPFRIVFGLSKTKDIQACLKILSAEGCAFHLVEAPNGRGMPVKDLEFALSQMSNLPVFRKATIEESVQDAIKNACQNSEIVIICGTFFIMGEVRKALGIVEPQDEIDMNERIQNRTINAK